MHSECPASYFLLRSVIFWAISTGVYQFFELGCVKLNLCLTLNSSITTPYVLEILLLLDFDVFFEECNRGLSPVCEHCCFTNSSVHSISRVAFSL